ncbi:uncharacterized protein LOC5510781 isoform X2 [Nematostella vectensis]|uniref:uncharacterized protein LOC5510781 isoform X2 n=1 Tax=Nematostella vectensis TaxID=45351 RepID=UPI0020774AF8|nr:uncharacterized protein LOC5510781 isoform X2 [Nematostella vectensis]
MRRLVLLTILVAGIFICVEIVTLTHLGYHSFFKISCEEYPRNKEMRVDERSSDANEITTSQYQLTEVNKSISNQPGINERLGQSEDVKGPGTQLMNRGRDQQTKEDKRPGLPVKDKRPDKQVTDDRPGHLVEDKRPGQPIDEGSGNQVTDQRPGHSVKNKSPAHLEDDKGPGHQVDNKGPGHQVDNKGLGHQVDDKGPGHQVDDKGPGQQVETKGPGHEVDDKGPGHLVDDKGPGQTIEEEGPGNLEEKDEVAKIYIREIHPAEGTKMDYGFDFSDAKEFPLKNKSIIAKTDFLRVSIHFKDKTVQNDLHASVVERPDVLARPHSQDAPLDIMILAFDSMSDAHVQRVMPLTYAFIKDELQSFVFRGFSVVGQATTPALTAMLTGRTVEENCEKQEGRRGEPGSTPIDGWPFIFKELKETGFASMFSEDDPKLGTFQMRLLGFTEPPVDHYARPMWYVHPRFTDCHGSQPQFVIQLEYLRSFMRAYPGRRKFGFTFLSDLCHQTLNHVSTADKGVADFLRSLKRDGLLENTMFIVMGDHGPRFGGTRHSTQGKVEESLPFLSVRFPEWFKKEFPKEIKTFQENTNALLSPLDLHATFLHLLHFSSGLPKEPATLGTSLFSIIPKNRSCADAKIPEYFCPCLDRRNIRSDHLHAVEGAKRAVKEINRRLIKDENAKTLCKTIKFERTIAATQVMPGKKLQTLGFIVGADALGFGKPLFDSKFIPLDCSYEIQFSASPGGGLFEAKVTITQSGEYQLPNIIRINAYGDLPKCIAEKNPRLRDYCVCL